MNWVELNRTLDAWLHVPLIQDPTESFMAVTFMRAVAIGLSLLCAARITQMVREVPRSGASRWAFIAWLRTPWWRAPALLIVLGILGVATAFTVQTFAGNIGITNRLGNLTRYLVLTYGSYTSMMLGMAWMTGRVRLFLRERQAGRA